MCMYAKDDGSSKVLVAKKPIKVYKYLCSINPRTDKPCSRNVGYSPIQEKRYLKGRIARANEFPYPVGTCFWTLEHFYEGLHSCTSRRKAKAWGDKNKNVRVMYIPKGALYIRGSDGNLLSNKLHWR